MLPHLRTSMAALVSRDLHRRLTLASRRAPLPGEALTVDLQHTPRNAVNAPLSLLRQPPVVYAHSHCSSV